MEQPSPQHYDAAARVGRKMCRERGLSEDPEDFAVEAQCLLLEHWLVIVEKCREPENPPLAFVGQFIRYRMTDWLREQFGRGAHRRKPHVGALSIETPITDDGITIGDTLSADIDLTDEALAFEDPTIGDMIETILACQHEEDALRDRMICEMIADGATLAEIGVTLQFTESRACQIVGEIGERVRRSPYARAWSATF